MLAAVFPASIFYTVSAADVNAKPTPQKVFVNGKETAFDAYNINGNNYFKLRDLAYALNGTAKQFEVTWDEKNNAIKLTSNKSYTVIGGEMKSKGTGNKTAVPTTSKIYLDGKEVSFTAYNIEGNNYFKLRDIGITFDFNVDYDEFADTITINTYRRYVHGLEFARAFGSYFITDLDDPSAHGVTQYYDTGKEKIKFETVADKKLDRYVLKINDNIADIYFAWFNQIIVLDDIIVITTGGTDIRSMRMYIFDFNGKTLFKTYYLNNKGMVIQNYIYIDGNKIIMPGTRVTHGLNLVTKNTSTEFSEYSSYLYQDTVYDYTNKAIEYESNGSEIHIFNGSVFSESSKLLNKNEIVEADFELKYLGGGKFDKIKMAGNVITLEKYMEELSKEFLSELLFAEPYPDSDTLAQTIFNPAIMLYCNFEGLGNVKFDGYSSEYFDSADYPDYFIEQGNSYVPVNDKRYPTYQSFVDELRKHFSEKLTQKLLSKNYYIERNGKFYMQVLDRGVNVLFHNVTYAVTSQTPGKVVFTATAVYVKPGSFNSDLPSDIPNEMLESKDFIYNYEQIDGKWVFTNFELFY